LNFKKIRVTSEKNISELLQNGHFFVLKE